MRLRHQLEGARSHMEGNVRRLQQDITDRMTSWRTLPAPQGGRDPDDEAGSAPEPEAGELTR